ncbi:hypothetical protein AaE_015222 [Aphanomyces astaci]|uniref:Uncharacterized protein n=1 Tax=Aphanomyces astaci TaxID=112090 RepID=A0A6A4Z3E4_APHAT|nr:hypothetical protein AaE_015222 [Aphanomyces astaci]
MFFVHRVSVPGTSTLLQPRRHATTVDEPPSFIATTPPPSFVASTPIPSPPPVVVVQTDTSTPSVQASPPVVTKLSRRSSAASLSKPTSHTVTRRASASLDVSPYLHEDDEPNVDTDTDERMSAFTTCYSFSSWDSAANDLMGDMEIFCARDSYSAESRLSDLVKLEQILVSPPRIRARTLSWSPHATLAETTSSVASNILRRRRSDLSGSEQKLVGVLDEFLECMKRVYDDRCLKVMPPRRVEVDLESMLHTIETARRQSRADAATMEAADEMVRMIHHVMEDVRGLHHFGHKGEVEYVTL